MTGTILSNYAGDFLKGDYYFIVLLPEEPQIRAGRPTKKNHAAGANKKSIRLVCLVLFLNALALPSEVRSRNRKTIGHAVASNFRILRVQLPG